MAPTALSHFNANAIAASLVEPVLELGRLSYTGRLLSIEEWLPFWERIQELTAANEKARAEGRPADRLAAARLYREYLRTVFPRSRRRFWAPDPVPQLLAQPFEVVEGAMTFFFTLQLRASGMIPRTSSPPTAGSDSSGSTPAAAEPESALASVSG